MRWHFELEWNYKRKEKHIYYTVLTKWLTEITDNELVDSAYKVINLEHSLTIIININVQTYKEHITLTAIAFWWDQTKEWPEEIAKLQIFFLRLCFSVPDGTTSGFLQTQQPSQ